MKSCRHGDWLRLWETSDKVTLEVTDRPRRLLREIGDPDRQFPTLLTLVGNKSKRLALTKLRLGNVNQCCRRNYGEIHLHIASSRAHRQTPLIIADGDIPTQGRLSSCRKTPSCHEIVSQVTRHDAPAEDTVGIADSVIHRALLTLTDVMCLFCDDIGGIERSFSRLRAWLRMGRASTSSPHTRLLLVVRKEEEDRARAMLRDILSSALREAIAMCFDDISVLVFPTQISRTSQRSEDFTVTWDMFQYQLSMSLELSWQYRRKSNLLFSARHHVELLHCGAIRAMKSSWDPFDFAKASRVHNETTEDLATHIKNFVELFESEEQVTDIAVPLLASSFIFDHYSPGMHGE
ncbi:hypothetical protein HIM_12517 [Hirsutella minnesotensis 3608]|uniref:Uncharacterized protein n=1 Tax=Hirsutella minnesotensis 3608 TaxID=1043627 RepID=A0A0F8A002_9HYPO|nr:hypothetical protein HIM_12517 [Hirsutella minnesotensis 3608]